MRSLDPRDAKRSDVPLGGHHHRRIARAAVPVLAFLALVATAVSPASNAGAQIDPAADGNVTITDASSTDYPENADPLVVCVDGGDAQIMEVGDQYFVEEPAGDLEVTVFEDDAATCTDTPDHSITIPLAAGDDLGLVIGSDGLFTFSYDLACMAAGTGRVLVANGADLTPNASADIYAMSQTDGQRVLLASSLASGASIYAQGVPADTYLVEAYAPGANPDDGPPLGFITTIDLTEGTFAEVYAAGSVAQGLGGFSFERGPDVCAPTEPPVEETETTTTVTSTTPPGTATPATPASGTATYTG